MTRRIVPRRHVCRFNFNATTRVDASSRDGVATATMTAEITATRPTAATTLVDPMSTGTHQSKLTSTIVEGRVLFWLNDLFIHLRTMGSCFFFSNQIKSVAKMAVASRKSGYAISTMIVTMVAMRKIAPTPRRSFHPPSHPNPKSLAYPTSFNVKDTANGELEMNWVRGLYLAHAQAMTKWAG